MKKQSLKKVSLLTVTVISSLALAANANTYTTYARDNVVTATSQAAEGLILLPRYLIATVVLLKEKQLSC